VKTSLIESFRVVSNRLHSDYSNPFNLLGVGEFPGVKVLETAFKINKRKKASSTFRVCVLQKTWKQAISRRSGAMSAKKCTKEHAQSCFSHKYYCLFIIMEWFRITLTAICTMWSSSPISFRLHFLISTHKSLQFHVNFIHETYVMFTSHYLRRRHKNHTG